MGAVHKRRFSTVSGGRGVLITGTTATGTLIHTSISGTTASGAYDEVYLYAVNTATANKLLTVEWAGSTGGAAGQQIPFTVPSKDGPYLIVPGFVLQQRRQVRAFAASASVITVYGYVNRIK